MESCFGKTPIEKDLFTSRVKSGDRRSIHSFKTEIGRGSLDDCLFGSERSIEVTKDDVTAEKLAKTERESREIYAGGRTFDTVELMALHFWSKNR